VGDGTHCQLQLVSTVATQGTQRVARKALRVNTQQRHIPGNIPQDKRNRRCQRTWDSLGCCIAALGAGPIQACREQVAEFGGTGPCALIGGESGSRFDLRSGRSPRQWQVSVWGFVEGKLDAPKSLLPEVHRLYFEPEYPEFSARTMWSLSNAFTSAFKKLDPILQFKATAKLGDFLESRFSQAS
jgi:hypothetical protein